jgi:hypothetical protein
MRRSLVLGMIYASSLYAQELPAGPGVKTLTFMQLASSATDAIATYRNDRHCYDEAWNSQARCAEYNPIARPLVMKGTPQLAGYFIGETSIKLAVPLVLDHYGHHKLARALRYWGIGDNAAGAAVSFARNYH